MPKRPLLLAGAMAALILVLLAGGAYSYYFSGLRTAPKALTLSSATPGPAVAAATPATSTDTGLSGTWTVASGSMAGFRATEQFVGQPSTHVADSRTSDVSGSLKIAGDSGGQLQVQNVSISAGLGSLKSVDQVAGRDVSLRDGVVAQDLQVSSFPTATFSADSFVVPDTAAGQKVSLSIPGRLTIKAVSKQVTVTADAQMTNGKIEVAGSVPVNMTDYGVAVPSMPFVSVQPNLIVQFDIFLSQG